MHKFSAVAPKASALTALRDPQAGTPRAPCQDGVFGTSLRKPMHNPGLHPHDLYCHLAGTGTVVEIQHNDLLLGAQTHLTAHHRNHKRRL